MVTELLAKSVVRQSLKWTNLNYLGRYAWAYFKLGRKPKLPLLTAGDSLLFIESDVILIAILSFYGYKRIK